jgi:hypothetical protein
MMIPSKLKDNQVCTIHFDHISGHPATLTVQMNPLTGDWLEQWIVGDKEQSSYVSKRDAVKMLASVAKKSKVHSVQISTRNIG